MAGKRSILITGCSDGGLGSALALSLHSNGGWRVIASARDTSKLTAVQAAGIECIQLDVVSDESVSAAVEHVKRLTSGSLDALINNAGASYPTPVVHVDIGKAHDLFELNLFSIIRVTRGFLPLLLKSTSDRGAAMVANNTSIAGLFGCGVPFLGAYNASKAAAISLTDSMRIELSPFGIRVVNLTTGTVKSNILKNTSDPKLPANSMYNIAKDAIEPPMAGSQPDLKEMDAVAWAKQVAQDLSKAKPAHMIYRGSKASTARIGSCLPVGTLDGLMKKVAGIDVLERRIQEQGGPGWMEAS